MTKANDLASLLDANGDVVSSALDNVPAGEEPLVDEDEFSFM